MARRLAAFATFSALLTSSACSSPMNTADIKQNPHPKQRYEITLAIRGAPGPFDSVTGFMQFSLDKHDPCVPKDPISGLPVLPEQDPAITFVRLDENTYRGTVYTDFLLDEDYYGKGACHWKMTATVAALKSKTSVEFGPSLTAAEVIGQKSKQLYFPKAGYVNTAGLDYGDGGEPLSESIAQRRDNFFSITISSARVMP